MPDPGDIACRDLNQRIVQLAEADPEALDEFFRLHSKRIDHASHLLRGRRVDRALCTPDDILQDVWVQLGRDARSGLLDRLRSLDELHRLIITVIRTRVVTAVRRSDARKRGGGPAGLHRVPAAVLDWLCSPTDPEADPLHREALESLLDGLPGPVHRLIARRRMDGDTTEAIATDLDRTTRTIDRKLAEIRTHLSHQLGDGSEGGGDHDAGHVPRQPIASDQ